jgi:hypothetical protein
VRRFHKLELQARVAAGRRQQEVRFKWRPKLRSFLVARLRKHALKRLRYNVLQLETSPSPASDWTALPCPAGRPGVFASTVVDDGRETQHKTLFDKENN